MDVNRLSPKLRRPPYLFHPKMVKKTRKNFTQFLFCYSERAESQ